VEHLRSTPRLHPDDLQAMLAALTIRPSPESELASHGVHLESP
jgi:hypothetical protein